LDKLILVLLISFCPAILFMLALTLWRKYQLKKNKAPFTDNFLRSPGETLFNQIQDLSEKISIASFEFMFIPVFIAVVCLLTISTSNIIFIALISAAYLAFMIYYTRKMLKLIGERQLLRLGYDGEVAAGQELNQLMLDGYNVYHDLPSDKINKFNIDHIVVGPDAVYAVETKAKSKSRTKRKDSYKVISNGKTLQFPNYTSSEFIYQADQNAKWLQTWLSKAVGEYVSVKPMVLLPGWYVERTAPGGVPVFNPKMVRQFLSGKEKILPQSLRTRIIHQLEQKCRDIEPQTVQMDSEYTSNGSK
jgi:hypothetical protein